MGCELKGFTKGGADFEAKIRGVNSVSGENLHDFEIISPVRGVRTYPRTPLRTGLYLTSCWAHSLINLTGVTRNNGW